ncbi:phosphotransferase [Nonomuraea jabiensis]|uniref:Aminoglycoside phosphotransferase (APT) family kinase protein n=1 Tax=Nonomuraea jabiensis TaxID=882448 RepID=A0A7W9L8L8_9ACTN|nr:phosphotransferase [Nonomuraea jabiensis]MBB5774687.1 aminoglycoside phosphotransferase (APT) family kinase protein [Nonomuraea jabiensis]
MEVGELLGSGRTADVYAIDDERVLRRYRIPIDARREAAVIAHVAGHGYPVPELHPGAGAATELVMGRLPGPTMLRALFDGEITAEEAGGTIARLLRRLHEIPALASADPGDRVLHLDLHPDNVMLTPRGPVVIDWCNSQDGPPGFDCAMSAVIFAQAAVDEVEFAEVARRGLVALVAGLGSAMDFGDGLDRAAARRAADRALTERETGLEDAAVALIRGLRPAGAG